MCHVTSTDEAKYEPARTRNLKGKVVLLVTGGTRGTGKRIALAMAAAGAKVIISGRDKASPDPPLSDVGRTQAALVGGYLSGEQIDAIWAAHDYADRRPPMNFRN
jgi:NAD(P)-dependent dehydrogenase (short-subunit alcohol dehydrogenase family)